MTSTRTAAAPAASSRPFAPAPRLAFVPCVECGTPHHPAAACGFCAQLRAENAAVEAACAAGDHTWDEYEVCRWCELPQPPATLVGMLDAAIPNAARTPFYPSASDSDITSADLHDIAAAYEAAYEAAVSEPCEDVVTIDPYLGSWDVRTRNYTARVHRTEAGWVITVAGTVLATLHPLTPAALVGTMVHTYTDHLES